MPVLEAWGINHYLVETDDDAPKISQAYREAQKTSKPVAVLIGAEYQQS
jgi:sulfopyruvate decarboxylase TPP-binding subunit